MPTHLGSRAERLTRVRALRTVKGRREQRRYAFEGATLLADARAAKLPIEELYATQAAYDATPLVRELDLAGTPCFLVDPRAAREHLRRRVPKRHTRGDAHPAGRGG